jgi:hypothetical protein
MKFFSSVAYVFALFQALASGASIPSKDEVAPMTRRHLSSAQVAKELIRKLSNTTTIYGPADSRYPGSISRWDVFAVPRAEVIVEPGHCDYCMYFFCQQYISCVELTEI